MILIGLGSNLAAPGCRDSLTTCRAALDRLPGEGLDVLGVSAWVSSAPLPASDQPRYVNAVAELGGDLPPADLLARLLRVEAALGRRRSRPNAARSIDLDLLAHGDAVINRPPDLVVPHPRLHLRAFVLVPLVGLAPGWRHPVLGRTAAQLLADLPPGQDVAVLPETPI